MLKFQDLIEAAAREFDKESFAKATEIAEEFRLSDKRTSSVCLGTSSMAVAVSKHLDAMGVPCYYVCDDFLSLGKTYQELLDLETHR